MKTMKHNKWWILLLSMVFVVIGMACSSDEPDEPIGGITGGYWGNHIYYPRDGILVMQLDNKKYHYAIKRWNHFAELCQGYHS